MHVIQFTENWYVCLHFCFKVSATFSNFCEIFCSTEWFQQHNGICTCDIFSAEWFQQQHKFTNEIDNMEVDELKCLAKFYFSVRKTDGSYYKKTSLLSIRAALDRNLKAPKSFKNMYLFMLFSRIIITVIAFEVRERNP